GAARGRLLAAKGASVQSPSPGRSTVSRAKPPLADRVNLSSTGTDYVMAPAKPRAKYHDLRCTQPRQLGVRGRNLHTSPPSIFPIVPRGSRRLDRTGRSGAP